MVKAKAKVKKEAGEGVNMNYGSSYHHRSL